MKSKSPNAHVLHPGRRTLVRISCWSKVWRRPASSSGFRTRSKLLTSDSLFDRLFLMSVKSIQLGQVWRNNQNGKNFLVTKVYSEVFTQYAILREADANAADRDTVRVKIQKESDSATIPGYTYTQDSQDF